MNRPLNIALGWRLPGWLLDWGPIAVVAFVGLAATFRPAQQAHLSHPRGALLALAIALCALAVRRRWPLLALAAILAVAAFDPGMPVIALPVLLAIFTVVEYSGGSRMVAAVTATAVVMLGAPLLHDNPVTFTALLSHIVAIGLAVSAALYVRTRADYIIGLRDRAERLERERSLLADQARTEERVRIARELHDAVAHNVSLMVVQAQALAATGNGGGAQAAALTRVADLGREAMSEMHRMLDVLRVDSRGPAEREPQPGVQDLPRLVTRTTETGLETELTVSGAPTELPPGVDLSAYRIVQEALTNVIRHAEARHASVTLAYRPDALEVTIVDDGRGPVSTLDRANGAHELANGDGHGLVGMRERVALFGGELTVGAGPGGGYRVHAVLPSRQGR
jgi:signal transduction histidine kinase